MRGAFWSLSVIGWGNTRNSGQIENHRCGRDRGVLECVGCKRAERVERVKREREKEERRMGGWRMLGVRDAGVGEGQTREEYQNRRVRKVRE